MKPFYIYWTVALIFKFFVSAVLPFSNDEAYYWVWSNHLNWSYFDHPGMIAWLNWFGHALDPYGLRWPSILVGHLSWIVWYETFKKFLDLNVWV